MTAPTAPPAQREVSDVTVVLVSLLVSALLLVGSAAALSWVDSRGDRHCWIYDSRSRKTAYDHSKEGCGD